MEGAKYETYSPPPPPKKKKTLTFNLTKNFSMNKTPSLIQLTKKSYTPCNPVSRWLYRWQVHRHDIICRVTSG